jgi:hypothetical protein
VSAVATAVASVAACITLVVGVIELRSQGQISKSDLQTSKSELEAHLQERMTSLDEYFAEHPNVRPHFYKNYGSPPSGPLRAEVLAAGEMVIDVAATVGSGMKRMDKDKQDQWRRIMNGYWCQSPAVRRNWSYWANVYTGDTADALGIADQPLIKHHFDWKRIGREKCKPS